MNGPTGYYDTHGIPIHFGDLIRVKRYRRLRQYQGRRRDYRYFRVEDRGIPVLMDWYSTSGDHQCLLTALLRDGSDDDIDAEVMAERGIKRDADGVLITFNERPRKRVKT